MTTLVMSGILIFGVVAYRHLPVSDLPTVDYPTITVSANLPGASPETMASSVATPLEKQFSTIAGLDVITSTSCQGRPSITLQFTLDRDIDAAAADVQAAIAQTSRTAAQGHHPAVVPEGGPVGGADPPLRPDLPHAAAVDARRVRRDLDRPAALDRHRRGAGLGLRRAEVRRPDPARPPGAGGAPARHRRGRHGRQRGQRQPADGHPLGHRPGLRGQGRRAAGRCHGRSGRWSWRTATAPPCGCRTSGRSSTRSRTPRPRPGSTATAGSSWRSSGSRAPTPSRSPHGVREAMGELQASAARVGQGFARSTTAPSRIRQSVNDVKFTLVLTLVLVVLVIFLFLRNVSATIIPSLALPMSLDRHLRRDVPARLQPRQPSLMALTLSVGFVVDDAIVMLENIVRHMEMGKKAVRGGARRGQGNRLHHPLDDAVAGGGVHPGAVHGRAHRPAVPRVRGHHRRRDPGVGARLAHADADAVQPLPPPRHDAEHGRFYEATERIYQRVLRRLRPLAWAGSWTGGAWPWRSPALLLVATVWLAIVVPKGFIPSEDQDQLRATTEAAEGTSFDAMRRYQLADQRRHAGDSNVAGFMGVHGRQAGAPPTRGG